MSEFTSGKESQPSAYEVLEIGKPLLEHFGIAIDAVENPEEYLEAIQQINPRYKGERHLSRQDLEHDESEWPADTKDLIMKTAESLRMVAFDEEGKPVKIETPLLGHYDAVIVLGAARQANLDRARYAVECQKNPDYETTFSHLVVAGSGRRLNEAEQANTANYAPDAQDEFDLCAGAARVVAWENPGLIVGLSYTDKEKAGTPDVIATVLEDLQKSEVVVYGDAKVAAITTQIYQVSTQMDLERVAKKFGITDTYVAGNPSDPELVARRTPATYLSEVVRTLKAAALLAESEDE